MSARRSIPSGLNAGGLSLAERELFLHAANCARALHWRDHPTHTATTRRWARDFAKLARDDWARFVRLRKTEGRNHG